MARAHPQALKPEERLTTLICSAHVLPSLRDWVDNVEIFVDAAVSQQQRYVVCVPLT